MAINEMFFSVGKIVGESIFASNFLYNGLFEVSINTGEVKFIDFFPDEKIYQRELHRDTILYKNYLIFIPANAQNITIYDIHMGNWKVVQDLKKLNWGANAIVWKEKLYIVPIKLDDGIQVLDLHTFELEIENEMLDSWCRMLDALPNKKSDLAWRAVLKKSSLWIAIDKTSRVVEIDLKTNQFSVYDISCDDLMCLYGGKDGFWMLPYHGSTIYQWNPETNEIEAFECQGNEIEKRYISAVVEFNGEAYALPAHSDDILKLDINQRKFNKWQDYPHELEWRDERASKFFRYIENKEKLYLLPFNTNGVLVIGDNMEFVPTKNIGKSYDTTPLKQYVDALRSNVIKEDTSFGVEDYLDIVPTKKAESREKNVGAVVWDIVNR